MMVTPDPQFPQLIEAYGASAQAGLTSGRSVEVPQGWWGVVLTRKGRVTDVLPPGTHLVDAGGMPGLAQAERLKPESAAPVSAAAFLVPQHSIVEFPWLCPLGAVPNGTGGLYSSEVRGWITFRITQPAQFVEAMWITRREWVNQAKEGSLFYSPVFSALKSGEEAVQTLAEDTPRMVAAKLGEVTTAAIVKLEIPLNELEHAAERIKPALAEPLAAAFRDAGLEPELLQVTGITPLRRNPCVRCDSTGRATGYAIYRRTISLGSVRYTWALPGNYCMPCGLKTMFAATGATLVLGWWGIIGFLSTPFYLIGNVFNLFRMLLGPKGSSDEPVSLT